MSGATNGLVRILRVFVIGVIVLWLSPKFCFSTVAPDVIGVRQSNLSGVYPEDLEPGWALRIPGVHRIIEVPRRFEFLDYTNDDTGPQESLQIRTQDNNIVVVDVSVPYHIIPGEGHLVVEAGNHVEDRNGLLRFQRLAEETTVSVLREHLAELTSAQWYDTAQRLAVADQTLEVLNTSLADLHVKAEAVLIRAVTFRSEYEQQLQQIQLNEQNKLLDGAREKVATKQQDLDKYVQGTNALAAAREQEWAGKIARLEGAYQVGFIDTGADTVPGAARRLLGELADAAAPEGAEGAPAPVPAAPGLTRAELVAKAAEALDLPPEEITDEYLLGIQNIQAETLEYDQRVRMQADGVSARLSAEGEATLATVRGAYESRINELLDSVAGRAYVAYQAADNVKFDENLVFQSSDGFPTVLRLRELTERFMGLR
ncbi:SPFH domain-containing protein [Paraliomyxa miuraensis]|uniref:SPFH domain-containing protein n=1 Tax=Paraliomyxa miuraensis TaxID=376150 RepID=UPI00225A9A8F|nr:SPFH domain-containing protein [Paraliomyxa miuraensis]MCX4244888.1 SPFH domain-containing protein [Paraliomyxa miuraensis]